MTNPEIDQLIRQLANHGMREQAIDDLVRHGSDAVEPLCRALESMDRNMYVVVALVEIGSAAVEPLCQLLEDKDEEVRWGAITALGKIGDARAVEPLCKALGDKEPELRRHAAMALEQIRDVRAVEPLCKLLEDKDRGVRGYAALALGEIGDARAVEPLCKALGNQYRAVHGLTRLALAKIGDQETLPRKVLAETRLTPPQRLSGLKALQRIQFKGKFIVARYLLSDIREYCQAMQQDDDQAVREGAQAVLAFLDSSSLLNLSGREETREPEEMLRVSDEGNAPLPQPQKRRGRLSRWLGR